MFLQKHLNRLFTRTFMSDIYPSRTDGDAAIIARQDPVVYGAGEYTQALSDKQINNYEDNGFLVLEDVFDQTEVNKLQAEVERLSTDPEIAKLKEAVIEPDSNAVRSVFRVHELSGVMDKLSRDPRLLHVARQILGSEVYIHQ